MTARLWVAAAVLAAVALVAVFVVLARVYEVVDAARREAAE